jgi:hypothetical protein
VSWRVFATDASQPDIDKLTEDERTALAEDLFGWVEHGPPRVNRRIVAGARLFEDEVPSGLVLTYFVDETEPYVAIVRVRGQ